MWKLNADPKQIELEAPEPPGHLQHNVGLSSWACVAQYDVLAADNQRCPGLGDVGRGNETIRDTH